MTVNSYVTIAQLMGDKVKNMSTTVRLNGQWYRIHIERKATKFKMVIPRLRTAVVSHSGEEKIETLLIPKINQWPRPSRFSGKRRVKAKVA